MTEATKEKEVDPLLEDLKLSLRLNDDEEDLNILNRSLAAAEAYVKGAVGSDKYLMNGFYEMSDAKTLYEIVVIAIASSYYTYRVANTNGRVNSVDSTSNSIIAQLRGKYDSEKERREADGSKH